jgi:hypothetical protein
VPAYEILYSTSGQGSVTVSHEEAEAGDVVTVKVDPAEGWQLESVKDSSGMTVEMDSNGQYTFVMPKHEEKITATFTEIPAVVYPIQWFVNGEAADAGEMGLVTVSHNEAEAGATITVDVMVNEGWKLSGIALEDGTAIEPVSENQYSFVMPEHEVSLEITMEELILEPVVIDENGEILWETVQTEVSWIVSVEKDAKEINKALGDDKITDKAWTVVAMLTGEEGDPSRILVLRAANDDADARNLLKPGALVLDNGEYVLLFPAPKSEEEAGKWNSAVKAGRKLMDLLCGDSELLSAAGCTEAFIHAVCSHGYGLCSDVAPEHEMEKVIFAVDELTGLIWAAAKMRPSKSCKDMELSSLKKKFKDKKFAAGCSRDVIKTGAEQLGWDLDQLLGKTLEAMAATEDVVAERMAAL